jgi:hypothetical protein
MPPGVPHWVVSTSNAICVGRHFYASSTIRFSVVGIVHAFFLGGALTNEDHLQTRTLLYQLLVFWSMRIDVTDIDGKCDPTILFACCIYIRCFQLHIFLGCPVRRNSLTLSTWGYLSSSPLPLIAASIRSLFPTSSMRFPMRFAGFIA